jgi:PIN domain nuclease of toxin-antitoxin system
MLNLDTNVVVGFVTNTLRRDEIRVMDQDPAWGISAIVLWEIASIGRAGKVAISLENRDFLDLLERVQVWPLSLEVVRTSQRLDFESDPADEIIAATSIVHRAPLVTRDARMLSSRLVPLAVS